MSLLEDFEITLKELVQARRLSASKMTKMTEIALKCMEQDTQLVSILYRTHKSLSVASKINSLYAFDSLARAARHKVNKYNLTSDTKSSNGNCASFLLKVEGVLDGLFQSMVNSGDQASKEKALKVLDIWTKASTFSADMISRLRGLVNSDTNQESPGVQDLDNIVPDNYGSTTPPGLPLKPDTTALSSEAEPNIQLKLMALLTQAASQGNIASQVSISTALEANQLALLQQLAMAVQQGQEPPNTYSTMPNNSSATPSTTFAIRQQVTAGPSNHQHPLYQDQQMSGNKHVSPPNRVQGMQPMGIPGRPHQDLQSETHPSHFNDNRGFMPRGSAPAIGRSHEREPISRDSRRDPRDPRNRDISPRDLMPEPLRRRSRSPQRDLRFNQHPHRTMRTYSPPRRAPSRSVGAGSKLDESITSPMGQDTPNLDEFGREIRVGSPSSSDSRETPPSNLVVSVEPLVQEKETVQAVAASYMTAGDQTPAVQLVPSASGTAHVAPTPNASAKLHADSISVPSASLNNSGGLHGLDKFDISTFDVTSVESWAVLGNMWRVTNGRDPSQEEIMQFFMLASSGMLAQHQMQIDSPAWTQPPNTGTAPTLAQSHWSGSRQEFGAQAGVVAVPSTFSDGVGSNQQSASSNVSSGQAPSGGKMQNVGGKWMFVKN